MAKLINENRDVCGPRYLPVYSKVAYRVVEHSSYCVPMFHVITYGVYMDTSLTITDCNSFYRHRLIFVHKCLTNLLCNRLDDSAV